MTISIETLATRIDARFGEQLMRIGSICDELTYEVSRADLIEVATALRDEKDFGVDQLMDVCGLDYLTYGDVEWKTNSATESGFSRGVDRKPVILDESDTFDSRRFAIVYHLLSVANNVRLRLRV
ncbi:MAG: NADH-quinone oxidoreductase subunit C, partial [Woeseia sp.]|nr:NADH-quinone oxidoreductase subunit C [Woeseia sp.]